MASRHLRSGIIAWIAAAAGATGCGTTARIVRTSPEPAATEQRVPSVPAKPRAASDGPGHTAADVHFMSAMIGHHAQAIVMARMAPSHDASAAVRTLAERIINAQQDEIALMQQWLRDRKQPVPEARPTGTKMVHGGVEHEMLMPGMLTEAQLKQLDAARGKEFDRLFLTFMIQHHQGAVAMVKDLFGSYGAGQDDTVFKLASDINVDQTTEIARMQTMLVNLLLEKNSQ
jgi:uncharacterized protein (DUF305 family)